MLAPRPFSWDHPDTWPWFIFLWLAWVVIILASQWRKPIQRWILRTRAVDWPTVQGQVELAFTVRPDKPFSLKSKLRMSGLALTAQVNYSYAIEGKSFRGNYQRELGSYAESEEFTRDLAGKSVSVSYNPRNAAQSTLTKDALTSLHSHRPPLPEGTRLPLGISDLPAWSKPLLWPLIVMSLAGLILSLWVHLGALAGRKVAPEILFFGLHIGAIAIWLPAIFISKERIGSSRRKDFWKAATSGAPDWVRYLVYVSGGYAIVNFVLFMLKAPPNGTGGDPPAIVWRGFSGHWMFFYSAAFAIFYSAAISKSTSRQGSQP